MTTVVAAEDEPLGELGTARGEVAVALGVGAAWWVAVAVTVRVGWTDWEVTPDEHAATPAKVPAMATATIKPFTPSG
jgi:hypothetical protein